jgi:hypothetical protein
MNEISKEEMAMLYGGDVDGPQINIPQPTITIPPPTK